MSTDDPSPPSVRRARQLRSHVRQGTLKLACALLVLLSSSASVHAKEEFPSQMSRTLSLGYDVPCSVCHIKGNTGASTPITPFALSLRERGLSGGGSALTDSLLKLQADAVDSDGDGVSDVAELKNATDPNSSANANIKNDQEPGYGCGGTAPQGHGDPGAPTAAALGLGWLLLRRRRARP